MENSLAHLAIDGVSAVRVGRRIELTVEAADEASARATVERLATELLTQPPHRGVPGRAAVGRIRAPVGGRPMIRVGVVVFPGSNCDDDALHGLGLAGGEPVPLWHESGTSRASPR